MDSQDDHRLLRDDEFWRRIPAYASLKASEFNDQLRNANNNFAEGQAIAPGLNLITIRPYQN